MATTFSCCYGNHICLLPLTTSDLFPWLQFMLVAPSNKALTFIHSVSWAIVCFISYRLNFHSFIHPLCLYLGQICGSSVCLFVCQCSDLYMYIASHMVTMDRILLPVCGELWDGSPSKSNMSSILDSVVAPSNKEIHFLFALGAFSEISSYFNYLSCCHLATRNSISCLFWAHFLASPYFILFLFFLVYLSVCVSPW